MNARPAHHSDTRPRGRPTTILVTAATGNTGRPIVTAPAARGAEVRALTRTPDTARFPDGVEVCDGAAPDFRDVDAVVLNIAALPQAPAPFLDAAKAAGVRRVVTVSALVAADGENGAEPESGSNAAIHLGLERAVEAAVPQWTHLRPGACASNAFQGAAQLAAGDVVRGPYARANTSPIHEADIADVAVRALLDDDRLGQALSRTGPEGLNMVEQVEILGRALERPLRFEGIGPEAAKQAMLSVHAWMKEAAVDSLLTYLAHSVGHSAPVTQEVPRVLGRPARTFAQWAEGHADAFRR
ncbi:MULTISPECIES: SDR family oxidoreductase [unclassified Streptomyces]|uniref:SDR family oxidoreductase n=1 Tax=unclassified Streptomyces TaxID=2593676 RepID=UPI0036E45950